MRRMVLGLVAVSVTACTSGAAGNHPTSRTSSTSGSSTPVPRRSAPTSTSALARPTPTRTVQPIPPVSSAARAAGLRDVRTIVPDALIDLYYATTDNFTGRRLYPKDARCLVHRSMARGLRVAARRLHRHGDVLVFWDCYRPHAVQVRMFKVVPNPNWVARPGPYATSHEAARSVDVTLAHADPHTACPPARRVQGHCLLRMGTGFDDFTPRAHAYATVGVSPTARANRAVLRRAMAAGGLTVYSGEWWHFDGPGAFVERPILHVPVD